ncbi:hypothetical protein AXK57_16405 [Tsukamurella pulmonis]|uniref:helix-turn-helix domain-containing protein n=1 Tax=Tsukamurella pulmonis TaxID=47312 RepID=UPI00079BADD3|nr:helix-turn-helix transcriptional regulator [Tsukamurella pulmonis]KXP08064.1 hypothetical protein AXK57_16405 [Tsukamurella pulmonis]
MPSARLRSTATLTALMEQERTTQTHLAAMSGCSKQFVNKLVNGAKDTCTPELATRIAQTLGVPTRILFDHSMSTNN